MCRKERPRVREILKAQSWRLNPEEEKPSEGSLLTGKVFWDTRVKAVAPQLHGPSLQSLMQIIRLEV